MRPKLEESVRSVSGTQDYHFGIRRTRKRKRIADESDDDDEVAFTDGCLIFEVEPYYVIIDRLSSCLSKQMNAHTDVCELFGVLFERVNVICMKKLRSRDLLIRQTRTIT